MSNSKYISGRNYEYKTMQIMSDKGFTCSRNSGSHGLWDIVCVRFDTVVLIQVKSTKAKTYREEPSVQEFRDLPVPECVRKELWVFYPRQAPKITIL